VNLVFYGCETWSLALREGHRVRAFGDRVLRGIFGQKGENVAAEIRWVGPGDRTAYRILVGKLQERGSLIRI
jgi:hypothetical protein